MNGQRVIGSVFVLCAVAWSIAGCSTAPVVNSGTGGLGGVGGQGGMGGIAVVTCGSDNPDDLIAEFMTDNGIFPSLDGRSGGWYLYGDDNGVFDPPLPPKALRDTTAYPIDMTTGNDACSRAGSFHVKGSGFNVWGGAAATDFVAPQGKAADGTDIKAPYDATKYKGVSFWAKATAPVSFVQVKFPDINTETAVASPVCVLAAGFGNNCSPYLIKLGDTVGTDFPSHKNDKIDTTWRRFDALFSEAKQDKDNPGYVPMPDKLDVAHMLGFAVQVNANFGVTPTAPNNFELWIDDVRFIPK